MKSQEQICSNAGNRPFWRPVRAKFAAVWLVATLLVSCGGEERERHAIEVAGIRSVMAEISKNGDRRAVIFFRTVDGKEVLRIPRASGLRFGWQYAFDPARGVVDPRTREKGAVLLMTPPTIDGSSARVGFIVITNKNMDYRWNCSLRKSNGEWQVTRAAREPTPRNHRL